MADPTAPKLPLNQAPIAPSGFFYQVWTNFFQDLVDWAAVSPATVIPLPDATPGVVGTSPLYARQDHVHPTDTTRAPIAGTITNDNAPAGQVGEFVSASAVTAAVLLTSGTTANVTSISLTAGDWDVSGTVGFNPSATTSVSESQGAVNTVAAALPGFANGAMAVVSAQPQVPPTYYGFPVGPLRVSIAVTTTVYLVAQATFTLGSLGAFGSIRARRVR